MDTRDTTGLAAWAGTTVSPTAGRPADLPLVSQPLATSAPDIGAAASGKASPPSLPAVFDAAHEMNRALLAAQHVERRLTFAVGGEMLVAAGPWTAQVVRDRSIDDGRPFVLVAPHQGIEEWLEATRFQVPGTLEPTEAWHAPRGAAATVPTFVRIDQERLADVTGQTVACFRHRDGLILTVTAAVRQVRVPFWLRLT